MRIVISALCLLILANLFPSCEQQAAPSSIDDIEEAEERPADWLFRQRAYPFGEIDNKAYRRAARVRDEWREAHQNGAKNLNTRPWEFDGPINVGGRITDVEVIPGSPRTLLVGAASGGVFRSTDEGLNWEATFDDMPTLAIGDIAVATSNTDIVYAGTGEANAGGGSIAYDGLGVFRSADGGQTWESRGLQNVGSIGRVIVDPTDEDRLYVGAMGTLFANNSERGVYRSLNGGQNWEQVLFLSDSTGAIDLALHPSDPNTIYAAMWERVRRPNRRQYTGVTSGVYKSTDGGTTWQELGNGLPTVPTDKGRISLAIAPSDPNRVYAGYVNNSGFLANLMRSDNGGDSWSNAPITDLGIVPYDWWFNRITVDPTDADQLYYVGFNINKYIPAEQRWELAFDGVHVDQHSLWINPTDPQEMILGNDGGLYHSTNGGDNYTKWENLPITQFYTCEVDFQQPERRYGGTQDNGTNRTLTGSTDDWSRIYGGDGFRVRVDPTNNSFVYATFQYGNFAKSIDGGDSFSSATNGLAGSRRNWYTPYELDPTNTNRLYLGAERVFRSDDQAGSWSAISPDLTNGSGGTNGLVYGTITSLSISELDNQVIWVGTDEGNVWVTTNGGTDWNSISTGLPQRWVTSITANPANPASAFLTFSGFRYGSNMSHIYETNDYGASWQSINGDLPDIPVNDLVVHPDNGTLFIATDIGVLYSENTGASWNFLGLGLPPVVVSDISLHLPTETLVAGTFGRSMWSIDVGIEVSTQTVDGSFFQWSISPNPLRESGIVDVEITQAGHYDLQLFDTQGRFLKTVYSGNLTAERHQLPLTIGQLPAGHYVLRLSNKQYAKTLQVIVQ